MVALKRNAASIQPSEASSSTSTATSQYSFSSLAESLNEHLIPAAAAAPALLSRALSHPLPQQQPTDALDAPPQHVRSMRTPPDLVHAFVMQLQDETQTSPLWGLGVFLMIVGTFASALGMLCLKRAHGPAYVNVPWYRNSYLWGGILLFAVTAAGLDVVVFGITPLALIAPFAGLTIVISFLFASFGCCGVRETPTKTTLVAVVLITTGVTICSIWGPKDHGEIDPIDLTRLFDQVRGFIALHTPTHNTCTRGGPPDRPTLAPLHLPSLSPKLHPSLFRRAQHPGVFGTCISGGILFLVFALIVNPASPIGPTVKSACCSWSGALSLAIIAAIAAALTQLQFKALSQAVMEVSRRLFDANHVDRQMYQSGGQFVLQLYCITSTATAQIGFLNFAISVAPVAYSVPAYQAALLLATLLLSGWVLGEYEALSAFANMMFWIGAGVVGGGMLLNAWGLVRQAAMKKEQGEGGPPVPGETVYTDQAAPVSPSAYGELDEVEAAAARKAASAKFG